MRKQRVLLTLIREYEREFLPLHSPKLVIKFAETRFNLYIYISGTRVIPDILQLSIRSHKKQTRFISAG